MSVRGKLTDPIFLVNEDLGELETQKRILVFGIHPVRVSRNSCKGYKATVIYSQ